VRRFFPAVVAALALAACGVSASPSPSPATPPPSAAASSSSAAISGPEVPESPIDGVVIDVQRTSLVDVQGFTIRTEEGQEFEFRIGALENAAEFPPSHLGEHMADGVPVRVTFDVAGTELVATHLDDAPQ
jgi:hypothetical protein